MKKLQTERLLLRPWRISDAESLYYYARDKRVGPIAGWPAHKSVAESTEIIQTIFMRDEVYAVTLLDDDKAIGLIGLSFCHESNFPIGIMMPKFLIGLVLLFGGKDLFLKQ